MQQARTTENDASVRVSVMKGLKGSLDRFPTSGRSLPNHMNGLEHEFARLFALHPNRVKHAP